MGNCMDTTARVDHSMNNAACECLSSLFLFFSLYICQLFPFTVLDGMGA
jgi:hypothetical protein